VNRAVLVSALALSSALAAPATPAWAETRIAVAPVQVPPGLPIAREEVDAAIQRGIETAGHLVVAADQVASRARQATVELACRTPACWTTLAGAAGAAHVVVGSVVRRGTTLHVQLRLLEGATGESVSSEENQCAASECALGDLVRLSARELVRRTLGVKRAPRAEAASPAAVAPPRVVPPAAPVVEVAASAPRRAPVWTLVAIGSGLACLAAGAALVSLDGANADRGGVHTHTTRGNGFAAIGVGLALSGVGARFFFSERAGGVAVGTRF
jgi:hypothetical protein